MSLVGFRLGGRFVQGGNSEQPRKNPGPKNRTPKVLNVVSADVQPFEFFLTSIQFLFLLDCLPDHSYNFWANQKKYFPHPKPKLGKIFPPVKTPEIFHPFNRSFYL
ncbi:MAG: hypothetical protein CM15mP8_2170 [Methanobacteriota archaeon]|nr:MAG: hypothetical protein CM15mP8_2170 [Euryarchaeota archaeon]